MEVLTIDKLHHHLGHVGHEAAHQLVVKGLVHGIKIDEDSKPSFCVSCKWGKGHRKAIQREQEGEQAVGVGNEIHLDIWGPAPVETINQKEYYVSFTDDHSRFTKIYLLCTKSEAFDSFEAWLQTQHNHLIKKFHTD